VFIELPCWSVVRLLFLMVGSAVIKMSEDLSEEQVVKADMLLYLFALCWTWRRTFW